MKKPIILKTTMKLYSRLRNDEKSETRCWGNLMDAKNEDQQAYRKKLLDDAKARVQKAATELHSDKAFTGLQAELDAVQKRSRVRTINADDICYYLIKIEEKLGIPKTAMEEVTVFVDANAQNFPSAYKGFPESTVFQAIYRNGSWRVTDIYRERTARSGHQIVVRHTETSKKALLDRYTTFGV
jgi:hypothetical protein